MTDEYMPVTDAYIFQLYSSAVGFQRINTFEDGKTMVDNGKKKTLGQLMVEAQKRMMEQNRGSVKASSEEKNATESWIFDTTSMDPGSRDYYIRMMAKLLSDTQLQNIVNGMLERGAGTFWKGGVAIGRRQPGASLEYVISILKDADPDMGGTYIMNAQGFEKALQGAVSIWQDRSAKWREKGIDCCERMIEALAQKAHQTVSGMLYVRIARIDGSCVTDASAITQWIIDHAVNNGSPDIYSADAMDAMQSAYAMNAVMKDIRDAGPKTIAAGFHSRIKLNGKTFDILLNTDEMENAYSVEQFMQILREAQAGFTARETAIVQRNQSLLEAARPLFSNQPPHVR